VLQFRPAAPAAAAQPERSVTRTDPAGARQEADKLRRATARAGAVAERAEAERRELEERLAAATAAAQTRAREARQFERAVGAADQAVAAAEVDVARARGRLPPS
jgi:hypothetical protein